MRKVAVPFLAAVAMCVFVALSIAQQPATPGTDKPKAADAKDLERYVPDQVPRPAPGPTPRRQDVIYAQTIVLEGRDARIVLNAAGRQPSITLESTRTKERVILYLTSNGQAVMGIQTPDREQLAIGMFGENKGGRLQVADQWGVEVLDRSELTRGAGKTGALPKK